MSEPIEMQNPIPAAQPEPAVAPAPYAAGTGSSPVLPGREALEQMTYRERLALKRSDPETYRRMRENG